MMPVRERILAGRYRLDAVIGRGGMSTVYRATDAVLGRTVAVKILLAALAEQDPTYAARFRREARAAAALASPSVVTVYDTGTEDGAAYIIMELVSGRSLAEMLAESRPLEVAEAIRVGAGVADALRAAHAAGILHRDVKPANVMVAEDGAVKVLDFGIARTLGATTLTQEASVVGTAAYMAPERALGRPGDERSDIYSLGCLLFAMLTGRPPFTGDLAAALLHQQVAGEPDAPSELRAGVPAGLDALVIEMLAKAPEDRPQNAGEVHDRLLAISGALPEQPAAPAVASATAATVAMRPARASSPTAPTRVAARSRRAFRAGALLSDHRARAVVLGLLTALVALIAIALLAGGGSSPQQRSSSGTRPPGSSVTQPLQTVPHPGTVAPKTPNKPPKHAGPGPKPPGHGGRGPGHGHNGPGGGDLSGD